MNAHRLWTSLLWIGLLAIFTSFFVAPIIGRTEAATMEVLGIMIVTGGLLICGSLFVQLTFDKD